MVSHHCTGRCFLFSSWQSMSRQVTCFSPLKRWCCRLGFWEGHSETQTARWLWKHALVSTWVRKRRRRKQDWEGGKDKLHGRPKAPWLTHRSSGARLTFQVMLRLSWPDLPFHAWINPWCRLPQGGVWMRQSLTYHQQLPTGRAILWHGGRGAHKDGPSKKRTIQGLLAFSATKW